MASGPAQSRHQALEPPARQESSYEQRSRSILSLAHRPAPRGHGLPPCSTGRTRAMGGTLVFRIEDTDARNATVKSYLQLLDALHWLGIDYDEGPDIEGPYAPYRQSERHHLHADVVRQLVEEATRTSRSPRRRSRRATWQRAVTPSWATTGSTATPRTRPRRPTARRAASPSSACACQTRTSRSTT